MTQARNVEVCNASSQTSKVTTSEDLIPDEPDDDFDDEPEDESDDEMNDPTYLPDSESDTPVNENQAE